MRISLFVWYSLPALNIQGNKSGFTWNSASISQKVLKNKGTITFSVRNPILGGFFEYELIEPNFSQLGSNQREAPVFELRYSHRFGKVSVRDGRSKNSSRLGKGIDDGESGQGMGQM